jgi:hypothetical protein
MRNFNAGASGYPAVVEVRPKSSKEKEISGFLNERNLERVIEKKRFSTKEMIIDC